MRFQVGVTLVFFNNLPFALINFEIGKFMVLIATVLSVYSGLEYFMHHKDSFMKDK